jgi:Sigma-70, region 4
MSGPQRAAIESPGAWLTTVASRICLSLLGSARARRERYVGEWIPEPLPELDERSTDPADRITLDESVTMAFLVVLESMTPAERVAFILHDVFRYPFTDVAQVTGRTPAACRQLASAARRQRRIAIRAGAVAATAAAVAATGLLVAPRPSAPAARPSGPAVLTTKLLADRASAAALEQPTVSAGASGCTGWSRRACRMGRARRAPLPKPAGKRPTAG